jgi:hypothetical protein
LHNLNQTCFHRTYHLDMILPDKCPGHTFFLWSSNISSRHIHSPKLVKSNAISHFLPPIPRI